MSNVRGAWLSLYRGNGQRSVARNVTSLILLAGNAPLRRHLILNPNRSALSSRTMFRRVVLLAGSTVVPAMVFVVRGLGQDAGGGSTRRVDACPVLLMRREVQQKGGLSKPRIRPCQWGPHPLAYGRTIPQKLKF